LHWIMSFATLKNNRGIEAHTRQMSMGVEILLQISRNTLTRAEE